MPGSVTVGTPAQRMCVCVCVCVCPSLSLSLPLPLCVKIYYMSLCKSDLLDAWERECGDAGPEDVSA